MERSLLGMKYVSLWCHLLELKYILFLFLSARIQIPLKFSYTCSPAFDGYELARGCLRTSCITAAFSDLGKLCIIRRTTHKSLPPSAITVFRSTYVVWYRKASWSALLRISLVTIILIFILHFPMPVRSTVFVEHFLGGQIIRSFSLFSLYKKRCTCFPSLSL